MTRRRRRPGPRLGRRPWGSARQRAAQQQAARASASKRRGRGVKPGTNASLRQSRRFQTLKATGKVKNVGQYRKRLSKARYLTNAQLKKRGINPKRYRRYIAKRTGQSMSQVKSKVGNRPRKRKGSSGGRPVVYRPRRTATGATTRRRRY